MPLEQAFVTVDNTLHQLKNFDCSTPSMNQFLKQHAIKHSKLGLSRTYVLPHSSENTKKPIAAYYTLASSTVVQSEIPVTHSLPRYPIPVLILVRLAVNKHYQGKGVGAKSLVYALRQAVNLHKAGLPAYGLILDMLDDQALSFYTHFELFKPFTNNPMRLFVPMKTLATI